MKIEPVLNSQISLLKKRNLGLAKLAEEYPLQKESEWDYEIRQNCEKIVGFITLLEHVRNLDSENLVDEDADLEDTSAESARTEAALAELPVLGKKG